MKKLTTSIAAFLLLAGGTLYAQSAPVKTKNQQSTTQSQSTTQQQGAGGNQETIGQSTSEPNSGKAKSSATTGTPPTHIHDTDASSANPQSGGVNAQQKKASAKRSGTGNMKKGETGAKNQQPAAQQSGQP